MTKRQNTEHGRAVADAEKKIEDMDRHRCHYAVDGMQCTALGVICGTAQWDENVKDPFRRWLCLAHYRLCGDHLGSREVIADLAKNPPKPPEDWREKMLLERGLGELQTAWRDMSPEEKQAVVNETIRKCKNFVRQATVRLDSPVGSSRAVDIDPDERTRQLEALYLAMSLEERAEYDRVKYGIAT